MDTEFVPIEDVVDEIPSSFDTRLSQLEQNIKKENIPSWILIPDRNAGEHATGSAWMAAVWGMCSSGEEFMKVRIAWDTEDRARRKSNAGDVPEEVKEVIIEGVENIENDVDMCVIKLKYDTEDRELKDLKVGFEIETETEEDK